LSATKALSREENFTPVRENKIVHIFADNQWFSAEKLYSFFTGVQFGLTPALPEEKSGWTSSGEGGIPENFTLPEKIKLYTFLLIINALVLKNFTVPLQVYNLASPRPSPK